MLLYSQLGVLLPSGSLWRLRNNDALDQIGILDNEGPALVGAAAQYFYDIGSSSNSVVNFSESASLYRHLYEHDKSNALATTWLMREANCYFFSDNLITASKSFEDLRNNKQLSQEQLLVVNYQLAKIYEKQLRTEETGIQSKAGQTKLHILRETIEDFANKFPNDRRSSELLLVLANFYRDSNELVTAKKYWQRVLVEKSEPIHRGLAIRGIVFATMHVDPPSTLVAVAQNFLTSENFSEIGREIRNELLGVLSAAMLKESQALRTAGKTKESGELLRTITQQFGDLPQSDLFLRDAAYMLAVSGDWTNALETANSYLSSSRRKFTGDMLYLRARANEYQMEFLSAAKSYIDLFDQAPQHAKAKMSLERAYSLATAEDDHRLAAEAAMRLAKAATAIAMKSQFLENAFHEAVIAENYRLAAEAAHELEQQKSSLSAPIRARLFFAALAKQEGQVQKSVGILKQLVKEVAPLRSKIASQEYQALSGELHFLLGKDAFDQFDGYILAERSGSALVRLQQKTAYFDEAAREFSNVIQNGSPKWSAAARYHYALAAEKFSDEMSTFIERNRRELGASYTGYNDSASRLRKMSTRFHADNLFAGRRDVKTLANDEWVRLSKLRLSKLGSLPAETDQSVDASVTPMPSQWR